MKNLSLYGFLLIFTVLVSSCTQSGLTVKGTIDGASNTQIFFDKTGFDNANQPLNKADVSSSGSFSMNMPEGVEAGIYRVRVGAKSVMLVLAGDEKEIVINGNLDGLSKFDYTIEGSAKSSAYINSRRASPSPQISISGSCLFLASSIFRITAGIICE